MESLGTLASGMAHDFNNILQTITDITGMVESETKEENTQRRMKTIADTLVDARFLVSELLAFGRKTPLKHKPIDMQEFLTTNVRLFDEQIGEKYETVLNIREDPLVIRGDADYLKRILQNLFGNARDAMPDGGSVTIDCFAERREGGDGTVVVRFADTGTGIPSEIAQKVFDPFFTTKKPGKGTGLGLALVQRIVSLHNGAVKLEKSGPTGTSFRLEFPEHDASDLEDDTKTLLDTRIPSRLLLLDDDPKIRDVLQFFLKEYGYQTCGACDADEALEALKKHEDDCNVLIMDWKLGDDDPARVIADLRRVKPELVVIVVSGYPADQKSIETLSIHRWFTKPYNRSQLDIEIQRALHALQKD
jgi:CheY-like chemotaxis protein/two-component sensor histidine kinase